MKTPKTPLYLLFSTFCSLLSANCHALWSNENVVFTKEVLRIEKAGNNTANIEQVLTLLNNSDTTQVFQPWFGMPSKIEDLKIFQDLDGVDIQRYDSQERLTKLFEVAQEKNDIRYLRLGQPEWPRTITTKPLTVDAEDTSTLKITYTTQLSEDQNWFWFDYFVTDEKATEREIYVKHPSSNFFYTNITNTGHALQKSTEGEVEVVHIVVPSEAQNQNWFFGWSENGNPVESFYGGFTYNAFFARNEVIPTENITLLVDTSGSIDAAKWNKTEETIRFLLNEPWNEKNIRLGFFTDSINWETTNDDNEPIFEPNNFEWRQNTMNTVSLIRPLGKTNIEELFTTLDELENPNNHITILITDEAPTEKWKQLPTPTGAFVYYDQNGTTENWKSWLYQQHGFALPLFKTQSSVIEESDITQQLDRWPTVNTQEIPENVEDAVSDKNVTIGRTPKNSRAQKNFSTLWGRLKIADLILTGIRESFTEETLAALESVRQVFGITQTFNTDMSIPELRNLFWEIQTQGVMLAKLIDLVPVYDNKTFDFDQRNNPLTSLTIAPLSEAQKELFEKYPDLVAEGFGTNKNIQFCTDIRCVTVNEDGTTEPNPYTRAYWNEPDKNHWSLPFVQPLVQKNIYPIAENGALNLTKPITRGDFAQILYDMMNTSRWRAGTPLEFTDLPEDHPNFEAISWFSEHKIIQGYEDGTVKPAGNITRAESMKILLAADLHKPNEDEEAVFADTTDWTIPWVNEAQRRGMIEGYEQGEKRIFKPNDPLLQGQAAKVITKFIES